MLLYYTSFFPELNAESNDVFNTKYSNVQVEIRGEVWQPPCHEWGKSSKNMSLNYAGNAHQNDIHLGFRLFALKAPTLHIYHHLKILGLNVANLQYCLSVQFSGNGEIGRDKPLLPQCATLQTFTTIIDLYNKIA
jgi:hypothetical protein